MKKCILVLIPGLLALLALAPIFVAAQEPTPAPSNSLLVTKTCAVADVKSNNRARTYYKIPDGIQPIFGNQLACNGDFGESQLLIPGRCFDGGPVKIAAPCLEQDPLAPALD